MTTPTSSPRTKTKSNSGHRRRRKSTSKQQNKNSSSAAPLLSPSDRTARTLELSESSDYCESSTSTHTTASQPPVSRLIQLVDDFGLSNHGGGGSEDYTDDIGGDDRSIGLAELAEDGDVSALFTITEQNSTWTVFDDNASHISSRSTVRDMLPQIIFPTTATTTTEKSSDSKPKNEISETNEEQANSNTDEKSQKSSKSPKSPRSRKRSSRKRSSAPPPPPPPRRHGSETSIASSTPFSLLQVQVVDSSGTTLRRPLSLSTDQALLAARSGLSNCYLTSEDQSILSFVDLYLGQVRLETCTLKDLYTSVEEHTTIHPSKPQRKLIRDRLRETLAIQQEQKIEQVSMTTQQTRRTSPIPEEKEEELLEDDEARLWSIY